MNPTPALTNHPASHGKLVFGFTPDFPRPDNASHEGPDAAALWVLERAHPFPAGLRSKTDSGEPSIFHTVSGGGGSREGWGPPGRARGAGSRQRPRDQPHPHLPPVAALPLPSSVPLR